MSMATIRRRSFESLKALRGEVFILARGDETSEITGVRGSTSTEQTIEQTNQQIRAKHDDLLVAADEYLVADEAVTPRAGDRFTDSGGRVLEAVPMGTEPCWRWSDPYRQVLRIHTQLISGS